MDNIRNQVKAGDYRFTIHAFERCVERNISPKEIENVIHLVKLSRIIPKINTDRAALFAELLKRGGYYMCSARLIRCGLSRHMTRLWIRRNGIRILKGGK